MEWLFSETVRLAGLVLVLFLLAAALAPLEALAWWAGWKKTGGPGKALIRPAAPEHAGLLGNGVLPSGQGSCFLVYLSGVGTLDANDLVPKEINFLDKLQAALPGMVIIRDVFPFSVNNNPLTGERLLASLWRLIQRRKDVAHDNSLLFLVQIHNLLQVATSADRRYGPVYSFGISKTIVQSLIRHGYQPGSRAPVILVCVSGGGQIAVGCTPSLMRVLRAPVWIISIGGVETSDPGILDVRHLYHLSGSKDHIQHLGKILYPGCWPIFPYSAWNRALKKGKVTVVPVGSMKHMGYGDYQSRSARLPDGQAHVDKTADTVVAITRQILAEV